MNKNVITLLLLYFFIGIINTGCDSKDNNPSQLIFGLKSYTDIHTIVGIIENNHGKYIVTEHTKLPESDPRPPYDLFSISTNYFNEPNMKGDTILTFFNNKLMSVTFYPNNWENYKKIALEKWGNITKNDRWSIKSNNIRIYSSKNYGQKRFIKWEDIRLSKDFKDWIWKHS